MKKTYQRILPKRKAILAALTLMYLHAAMAALTIPGLYNTGVNDNGAVLPVGSTDSHYGLTGPLTTPYVLPHNSAWVTAPAGSAWIGPNSTSNPSHGDPAGYYSYQLKLTLDLTGFDLSTLQIGGYWASDNSCEIYLNGASTGFHNYQYGQYGFTQLEPFLLESGFRPGINTLEFLVLNLYEWPGGMGDSPSGLLVTRLTAANDGSLGLGPDGAVVPEPSTFIGGALLAIPFGLQAFRRVRKPS